ncbi:MAG: hypothetical protein KDA71_10525, partial [Planctomycetales bacterium]|nr:hypothetical protein [Planctomycetales bacterium]
LGQSGQSGLSCWSDDHWREEFRRTTQRDDCEGPVVQPNQAVHVAVVRTTLGGFAGAAELKLFVNGQLFDTTTRSDGKWAKSPERLRFGAQGTQPYNDDELVEHFTGLVDEIRVSSNVRYTESFTPPTRSHRFTPDEHTLALYHCDEAEGDKLVDSSGNERHGKILGPKLVRVATEPVDGGNAD